MKFFFTTVWLLLLLIDGQAQSVLVEGVATNSKGGTVQLVVNDTLRRIWRVVDDGPPISAAQKQLVQSASLQVYELQKAGYYVQGTDSVGKFKIVTRSQDSITFSAYGHLTQTLAVRDLLRQPTIRIRLLPRPCQEYVSCQEDKPTHFVFIGRKQKVSHAEKLNYCNRFSMDSKFTARYRVLENVYNTLPDTVVNFVAYDHYGWPKFSYHETVLLFVSRYCGEYVHQKYQYYPIYQTVDGKWAAPVMANDLTHPMAQKQNKPTKLTFKTPVEVDITNMEAEQRNIYYPAPYYRVEGNKAVAVYGNYVDELLQIKKITVLKARGIELN